VVFCDLTSGIVGRYFFIKNMLANYFTAKTAKILYQQDFVKTQSSQSVVSNQLCELCVYYALTRNKIFAFFAVKKLMCKNYTYFSKLQEGTGYLYFEVTLNWCHIMVKMLK
jgi:hypothetical protein